MSEATVTFRVDDALKAELSSAAKSLDRTGAQLLRDFMRDFVQKQNDAQHEAHLRRQIQAGLDSANACRLVPHAQVQAQFAERRAATRQKLDSAK